MEIEDLITRLQEAVDAGEITQYSSDGGWDMSWRDLCAEALIAIRGMQKLLPVNRTFDSHEKLYHGWGRACTTPTSRMVCSLSVARNTRASCTRMARSTALANLKWIVGQARR